MANARILFTSHADDVVTLTATSEGRAVENIQTTDVQDTWRSTSSSVEQEIEWEYPGRSESVTKKHNAIVLVNVNSVQHTSYKIELSNDANFSTLLYAARFNPFTTNTAHGMAVHWFTTAGEQVADANGDLLADSGGDVVAATQWGTLPITAKYARLTVTPAVPTAGDYLEIGRVKVGEYFDAPNSENIAIGPTLTYPARGELVVLRSGGMRAEQKTRPAEIRVTYEFAHEDDSYLIESNSFAELLEYGHESDLFFSAFPGDGDDRERRFSVLGRLVNTPGLTTHFIEGGTQLTAYQRAQLTIREAL